MATDLTVEYMRVTGRWWELDTIVEVGCAVGMVAAQLDSPLWEAALVLRAHAAVHTQDPVDVALEVVRRELSFAP